MNVEQFKKDVAQIIASKHGENPPCRVCQSIASEILAYHTFKELVDKAQKYDELLEQTKEVCQRCDGKGILMYDGALGDVDCPTCHHTGSVYHPERIVVLNSQV